MELERLGSVRVEGVVDRVDKVVDELLQRGRDRAGAAEREQHGSEHVQQLDSLDGLVVVAVVHAEAEHQLVVPDERRPEICGDVKEIKGVEGGKGGIRCRRTASRSPERSQR